MAEQECGYCGGRAVKGDLGYVHAEDGDRVKPGGPGDFVSAGHNRAGTRINPVDLVDAEEPCERCGCDPITDEDAGLCDACTANNDGRVVL